MYQDFLQSYHVFRDHGVENPLYETLHLFDLLFGGVLRNLTLPSLDQDPLDLIELARKRKEGMPLEYIIGQAPFMGATFYCGPEALIPRQETELLAHTALDFIREMHETTPNLKIIDVGTGCGNIAISLAMNAEAVQILASDISPAAFEIAKRNIAKFNLQKRVSLFCGDLFSPFSGTEYWGDIDIIVCNPPYIPTESLGKLDSEIIDFEPRLALDAGAYGLGFYRQLIAESHSILKPGGILVFEIGAGQERLVTRLLERSQAYKDINYFKDDAQKVRVISASAG